MKSIYSVSSLQRILDHWGVGTIEDVTYFQNIGRSIWRHYITTTHGEFELYSHEPAESEYAKRKIAEFLQDRHGEGFGADVHCFDRYHTLCRLTVRHRISYKQADGDLQLLLGKKILKAFRVYGSIFQIHIQSSDVNVARVLVSYGHWSISGLRDGKSYVFAQTTTDNKDRLDAAIKRIEVAAPQIREYRFDGDVFEVFLSGDLCLRFWKSEQFEALKVHLPERKNNILIYAQNEMFYTKDL